jgi:hypothetical protein
MKLSDMIISAIIKRGILYEGRNIDVTIDIPLNTDGTVINMPIRIKAEHMSIKFEKE